LSNARKSDVDKSTRFRQKTPRRKHEFIMIRGGVTGKQIERVESAGHKANRLWSCSAPSAKTGSFGMGVLWATAERNVLTAARA